MAECISIINLKNYKYIVIVLAVRKYKLKSDHVSPTNKGGRMAILHLHGSLVWIGGGAKSTFFQLTINVSTVIKYTFKKTTVITAL